LIKLSCFALSSTGKVTLTDQDYFDELLQEMSCTVGIARGPLSATQFHKAREAIDASAAAGLVLRR